MEQQQKLAAFRETSGNLLRGLKHAPKAASERIKNQDGSLESGHTAFKFLESRLEETFPFTRRRGDAQAGYICTPITVVCETRRCRTVLYFKEIQILSDTKVRRGESATRWVVVGRIGGG